MPETAVDTLPAIPYVEALSPQLQQTITTIENSGAGTWTKAQIEQHVNKFVVEAKKKFKDVDPNIIESIGDLLGGGHL
jgi:hypothetical protein